ncbi:MAG: VWA domain-containing protein [Propionibacteriaceae bacterium]
MIELFGSLSWLWPRRFRYPMRALCLLLIPAGIAFYIFASKRRSKHSIRYTNTSVLAKVMSTQKKWLRHLAVVLSLLTILTLTIAFMIPLGKDHVPRERATVVIVVDTSLSMSSTDVAPNRLDSAKEAATELVKSMPSSYNIAVVSLAGSSSLLVAPTTDRAVVLTAIEKLEPKESTALGDALRLAVDAVGLAPRSDDESPAPASIVLLSDGGEIGGEELGEDPELPAQEARKLSIPIFTVAYGTQTGYVDVDGTRQIVPPNTERLEKIATISGGELLTATSEKALEKTYTSLQTKVGYEEVDKEVTARWAGFGLVFGVLAALAAVMMAARWP